MSKPLYLNIYKQNPFVRQGGDKLESSNNDSGVGSAKNGKEKNPGVVRKRLNIPIGDVDIDPEYDKMVASNFEVPPVLIRHTRKVGDEADLLVDYVLEDDDEQWLRNNPRIANDKEVSKLLTAEAFETLINLFEKHTGQSPDPVPLYLVERYLPQTTLHTWNSNVVNKVLPEVYHYWSAKRNTTSKVNGTQGKAICRKHWHPTQATDTNPHHTFRARDKEQYRLRRKQKKNDLDSFRKLQQLRREFGQARIMSQLLVEREKLQEASTEMQKQIFEQKLFDNKLQRLLPADSAATTSAPSPVPSADGRRCATSYTHSLTYEHLLYPAPVMASSYSYGSLRQLHGDGAGRSGGRQSTSSHASLLNKLGISQPNKKSGAGHKASGARTGVSDGVDDETGVESGGGSGALKLKSLKKMGLVPPSHKRKYGSGVGPGGPGGDGPRGIAVNGGASAIDDAHGPNGGMSAMSALLDKLYKRFGALQAADASQSDGVSSAESTEASARDPTVPLLSAFSTLYRTLTSSSSSLFPSFMEPSELRSSVQDICPLLASTSSTCHGATTSGGGGMSMTSYLSGYMDDLLLRHQYGSTGQNGSSEELRAGAKMEDSDLSLVYPRGFKCRARVGRGGRVVTDRIPVYSDGNDGSGSDQPHDTVPLRVVYATVLNQTGSLPSSGGNSASSAGSPHNKSIAMHSVVKVPTMPLPRFTAGYFNVPGISSGGPVVATPATAAAADPSADASASSSTPAALASSCMVSSTAQLNSGHLHSYMNHNNVSQLPASAINANSWLATRLRDVYEQAHADDESVEVASLETTTAADIDRGCETSTAACVGATGSKYIVQVR